MTPFAAAFPAAAEVSVVEGTEMSPGPVLSLVVDALHRRHAGRFGISFPDMRDADRSLDRLRARKPTLGSVLRVSGGRDDLRAMLDDPDVARLASSGYVDLSGIARNGSWPDVRVRPMTDASEDRRARRHARRAAARGEVRDPDLADRRPLSPLTHAKGEERGIRKERQENLPHVLVASLSNGHRFTLGVARRPDGDEDWVLCSYGLLVRPPRRDG